MSPDPSVVHVSPLEEERFGIRTARAEDVTLATLPAVLDFCREHAVVLLIARSLVSELRAVQAMEREGFLLMDTLVYCARDLRKPPLPNDTGQALIRPFRAGEEEAIKAVAADVFRGYFGHYHADERLDPAKCDEAYVSWAVRSCASRDVADEILVAELDGEIAGFVTLQLNPPDDSQVVVGGVSGAARGQGIYRSFLVRGMEWFSAHGARRTIVSTPITNIATQKTWAHLGFQPLEARYTFHKWFEQA